MQDKKLMLEYHRVKAGELDLELRILDMTAEMQRIQQHLDIQRQKVKEIESKLEQIT